MEKNYELMNHNAISEKINDYAFIDNENLVEFVIPEEITCIGERAFSRCKNLKRIIIPDSVTEIGPGAFSECESLEEVILSKNLKKLNYRTFADCKRLKKIVIPEGMEELDWAVFAGCENLEEIVLPESIKKIDKQLFLNCKKLKTVILPQTIKELPDEFFKGCRSLNLVLHSNITKLGNRTFEDCYRLTAFPENVTEFGENCFKNCRNITGVTLNPQILRLADGLFEGCIRLKEIQYQGNGSIPIGKRTFRNCRSLEKFPYFIANFNEKAFENCISLREIDIIDRVIPFACFRGCQNLETIHHQERIYNLFNFAFSGCESLREITLEHMNVLPAEAFSYCKKLQKVRLNITTQKIKTRAFFNCYSLSDFVIPDMVDTIQKEAFKNCRSIKQITIPANLKRFGDGAFSFMDSLETIDVSFQNKTFMTPDHKILIHQMHQKVVLYAMGCKDKSYSFKDYNIELDILDRETIRPLVYIGEYAFAGAKNLEELTVCSCLQDIESSAFVGCDNLKKMNIESVSLFSCPGFNIREHGKYYMKQYAKIPAFLPFETVVFSGNLVQISARALENFTNLKTIIFPRDQDYRIGSNAFSDCNLLQQVNIPRQVQAIDEAAFPSHTQLTIENGLTFKGLVEMASDDQYIGNYRLYTLEDGTYSIEQGDQIYTLTKKHIDEVCSHSEEIRENPILFLNLMNDLISHDLALKILFNGILMSTISMENRSILFKHLKKDDSFFLSVLKNSRLLDEKDGTTEKLLQKSNLKTVVNYIELLRRYHIDMPVLHNKLFMAHYDIDAFERLIRTDLPLFIKTIVYSHLIEAETADAFSARSGETLNDPLIDHILRKNTLETFILYAKKYDIKDRYLFSKPFIAVADHPLAEELFSVYDANSKRVLKSSMATDKSASAIQNINDLFVLMKITGALEENPVTRQKASTFICEKIFAEFLPNGQKNEYRIVGDDIHRIFNFLYMREGFDPDFANFFLENYPELVEEEKKKSGFIQRTYLNFSEIAKTHTSHKGIQRQLKVTVAKCKSYLSEVKFDGVTKENEEFAKLIGTWYSNRQTWINAQKIHSESQKAPRNIFTKIEKDDEGNAQYDNDPGKDLKEEINSDYSFEWLPKQDYDNLILGKYCNCCAHIEGAGQGIMRASMILDNCQNLVIRNNLGEIIAKSTIYVNRKEGYAVLNNVETSLSYKNEEALKKIYRAFLRGVSAFMKAYNENNQEYPLTMVTVGTNRNTLISYLTDDRHPLIEVQKALYYGEYSLTNGYGYNGDWSSNQRLVLKK